MSVAYSPLCDDNIVAYLAYLYVASGDGASIEQSARDGGGACIDSCGRGRDVHGSRVTDVFNRFLGEARTGRIEMAVGASSADIRSCVDSVFGIGRRGGSTEDAGMADSHAGGRECGDDSSVRVGCDAGDESGTGPIGQGQCVPDDAVRPVLNEGVSEKTKLNREKRQKKKERKLRKQHAAILQGEMRRIDKIIKPDSNVTSASGSSTACDVKPIQQRVDDSVKEKWILKNKLETMELERKIKLLQNTRVEDDIKAANLKVRAAIERQMVGIEKTHSKLAASDCVPVDDLTDAERSSRVHTLQSGLSPDTISPNSSASMAEFRAVQKKNLDLEKTNEKLREMLEKCGIDRVRQEIAAKSEWTCDENMCLTEENEKLICQTDIGYVGPLDGPHLCDDGKYRMELDLYDDRERVMYIDPFGAN